jgi:hypothetical protein
MGGYNLPPGCSVSDIPGNRPEDAEWDEIYERFWDKERITKTHIGVRVSESEYKTMDKLYASPKYSGVIDDYITAAIEYGMEIGAKEAKESAEASKKYDIEQIETIMQENGMAPYLQEIILESLK